MTVSLTFDDQAADQFQARALLSNHGMHGTFYVNSGRIGLSGYMTQAQLQSLASDGNEIAGHTVAHADLPTLSLAEQQRQVWLDRNNLLGMGFQVFDFAYPYGDYNATAKSVVQGGGYNSARTIGGIVTPTGCSGCPFSDTIPPRDLFAIATPDSVKSSATLAELENSVNQAEQHDGGWLVLTFHHIGVASELYSVDTTVFTQFLDWLQTRPNTTVKTVHEVIGGALQPQVTPPQPSNGSVLQNASLEVSTDGVLPDCWRLGGAGTTTATGGRTSTSHTGSFAYRIDASAVAAGADKKVFSQQDLGQCAPSAAPGQVFNLSAWYQTNAQARLVAYYRTSAGGWVWWAQSPGNLPPTSGNWALASLTLPPVPLGATGLSVAMSIRSPGFVIADDFGLVLQGQDATAPTVTMLSPADGSSVHGTITMSASASDNTGVTKVEFYANGALVSTDTSSPYASDAWDSTQVTDGTYGLTAKAYDAAGNSSTSTMQVNVENTTPPPLDTTAPSVNLTSPVIGATVKGTISLAASANDNVGGSGVASVSFLLDNVVFATDTTAPYTATLDTTIKVDGQHLISATAQDVAGNSRSSGVAEVTFANNPTPPADTTAPAVSITAPANGATVNRGRVEIDATASDNTGVTRVDFSLDGNAFSTSMASPYYSSWDATNAAAGTHTFTARAWDAAGNSNTASVEVTVPPFPPDTTAPEVAVTAPTEAATVKGTVAISATATDDVAVTKVDITVDGATLASPTGPYEATWDSRTVPDGQHTIKVTATDAAGNSAFAQVTVTVQNVVPDTTAPTGSFSSPANGSTFTKSPLKVIVQAADTGGSGMASVTFLLDGVTQAMVTGTGPSFQWNWNPKRNSNGQHTITAVLRDVAGNTTTIGPLTVTAAV